MNCHPDFGKGKRKETIENLRLDEEWKMLTDELNAIGPPSRSSFDWRKVWTDFKANKKRRSATNKTMAPETVSEGIKRKRFGNWSLTGNLKTSNLIYWSRHGNFKMLS